MRPMHFVPILTQLGFGSYVADCSQHDTGYYQITSRYATGNSLAPIFNFNKDNVIDARLELETALRILKIPAVTRIITLPSDSDAESEEKIIIALWVNLHL